MFFDVDYEKLEETARRWLDASHGLISEAGEDGRQII
jgi:hypothetical protein